MCTCLYCSGTRIIPFEGGVINQSRPINHDMLPGAMELSYRSDWRNPDTFWYIFSCILRGCEGTDRFHHELLAWPAARMEWGIQQLFTCYRAIYTFWAPALELRTLSGAWKPGTPRSVVFYRTRVNGIRDQKCWVGNNRGDKKQFAASNVPHQQFLVAKQQNKLFAERLDQW